MIPIQDSKLVTTNDIMKRIETIRRNRDKLCDTPCRSNHVDAFRNKQKKIAKLTEREGVLLLKLKQQ